jgi:hypothetical protein
MVFCGCSERTPVRTVQMYLQVLSGERELTPRLLESITTENYRSTEQAHLATIDNENRMKALDLAEELKNDPAIQEFMRRVTWTTTYDTPRRCDETCQVIARVILSERRPGDRDAALQIPNLRQPLKDALRRGLELPFQFGLIKENGQWKIDEFEVPDVLKPLLQLPE